MNRHERDHLGDMDVHLIPLNVNPAVDYRHLSYDVYILLVTCSN